MIITVTNLSQRCARTIIRDILIDQDIAQLKQMKGLAPIMLKSLPKCVLVDPLVIMIGIGDYSNVSWLSNLVGVPVDYTNMESLWSVYYRYKIYFENEKSANTIPFAKNTKYKLYWTTKDIWTNLSEARDQMKQNKNDSLICIISSHGKINSRNQDCIIDSENKLIQLETIYNYFKGTAEYYLQGKTKLFFIDCCRCRSNENGPALPVEGVLKGEELLDKHPDAHLRFVYGSGKGYSKENDYCSRSLFYYTFFLFLLKYHQYYSILSFSISNVT